MCDHLNREMTELSRERLELSTSYEERCIELAASEASCASVSQSLDAVRQEYTDECLLREQADDKLKAAECRVIELEESRQSLILMNENLMQFMIGTGSRRQSVLPGTLTTRFASMTPSMDVTPVKPVEYGE